MLPVTLPWFRNAGIEYIAPMRDAAPLGWGARFR
jgi:hypothetical protein